MEDQSGAVPVEKFREAIETQRVMAEENPEFAKRLEEETDKQINKITLSQFREALEEMADTRRAIVKVYNFVKMQEDALAKTVEEMSVEENKLINEALKSL